MTNKIMSEEIEDKTGYEVPTKEEMIETIKSAFKDNEEGLKLIDSIMNNLVKLKELERINPQSASFRMWMMYMLFLLGGSCYEQPIWGLEPSERKEDETDKTKV